MAIGYLLANARQAVREEIHSSVELASTLLASLLSDAQAGAQPADLTAVLARLEGLRGLRHLDLRAAGEGEPRSADTPWRAPVGVPAWFATLVRPAPTASTRLFGIGADRIELAADPADEISEAWREVRGTLLVLLGLFAGALAVMVAFLGRALAPLSRLSRALDEVGQGDYGAHLAAVGLPDLDRITERFNHMTDALARSRAENAVLTQRSLAIQEDERQRLAHELHDELGQSITAIKAVAVSIAERSAGVDAAVTERAGTIAGISSEIYARVRGMIARLHPAVLDELGLVAALELMIDDWNTRHEECFCSLHALRAVVVPGQADRIALYRIAQEALTNVARHAAATACAVELREEDGGSLLLEVRDDGRGFVAGSERRGLGLLGMRERAAAMGGSLALVTAPGQGVTIRVHVPPARWRGTDEHHGQPHSHPAG